MFECNGRGVLLTQWQIGYHVTVKESKYSIPPALNRNHIRNERGKFTYVFTVVIGLTGTAKQFSPQQIAVILQKGQVEIPKKLHMLVLHS